MTDFNSFMNQLGWR